jgi:YcxB-like protein
MSEKIDLTVQYTAEDYERVTTFMHYRQRTSKFVYVFGMIFFCIFALFVFYVAIVTIKAGDWFLPTIFICTGIVSLLFAFGLKPFQRFFNLRNLKAQLKSSPLLSEEKLISFSEEGISGEGNFSNGMTKWEAFIQAGETENDFLFFMSDKSSQFVPKRAFKNDEQQNQLRELVKLKLGDKAKF